jgi:hypothetical protein
MRFGAALNVETSRSYGHICPVCRVLLTYGQGVYRTINFVSGVSEQCVVSEEDSFFLAQI